MKITLILAAATLALPVTAAAQSLDKTHHLVWQPSGKTPAATYRPRAKASCVKVADHRAGKGQYRAATPCPSAATPSLAAK